MSFSSVPICHCGKKFDISKARKEIAPPEFQPRGIYASRVVFPTEVWVCERCGGIHHTVQEVQVTTRGPLGHQGVLHALGKANGQSIITFAMPGDEKKRDIVEFHTYPRRFFVQPEPLIFQCWQLLMDKVAIIKAEPEGAGDNEIQARDRDIARHQARGIAETLGILMRPFVDPPAGSSRTPADMVVKYAIQRFEDPNFVVPGLGEHLWDATKNPDGSDRIPVTDTYAATHTAKKAAPVPAKKAPVKSDRKLDPAEIDGIKAALDSGMFDADEVASMFKVTVDEVKRATST